MGNNYQEIRRSGFLNEFFWWCAGVNRDILRKCPMDYAKYAGSGGTIFFTAVMAVLSSGYALYTVFDNVWIAYGFGIVWGFMIFNLDRYIVNTMYSDGKPTISLGEIGAGLPRIIMAIFLGIVISTPLELKIFEDAIDIRIEQDKDNILKERISSSVQERDAISQKRDAIMSGVTMFDSQITTSSKETNSLLSEINELRNKYNIEGGKIKNLNFQISSLQKRIVKVENNNPEYGKIERQISELKSKRAKIESSANALAAAIRSKEGELAASDATLKDLITSKQEETRKECDRLKMAIDSINNIISEANIRHKDWSLDTIKQKGSFRDKLEVEYKGFQAKMKAFSELREESPSTYISSIFIMLLFIIIETAPTFFKMMMTSGPYDDMLRAEMHRVRVMSDKEISDINDEVNTLVQISVAKNKAKLEAELAANKEVMEKVALAQAELLQTAIDKWREEELAKINENPSAYIQTTNRA